LIQWKLDAVFRVDLCIWQLLNHGPVTGRRPYSEPQASSAPDSTNGYYRPITKPRTCKLEKGLKIYPYTCSGVWR